MRNLWKGAISFGLVHVPVKLYAATEKKEVKFNYIHNECKTPIKYERVCPTCSREVSMDEIVKGYEYEKGRYVILSDEDFENIPTKAAKTVEIVSFVDYKAIDPILFDKSYYLAPGEGGQKPYELLRKSMEDSGKAAVAKVVIRSKESPAVIRVYQNVLLMETMFYVDEVRATELMPELHYTVQLTETEENMAKNLIDSLTDEFKPELFENDYRKALHELIQAKIAGEEIEVAPHVEQGKVVDLMEALKASIELAKKQKDAPKEKVKRATRKKQLAEKTS